MSSIKISKDFLYQVLFAICIFVTYLNIYELTFLVWIGVILFTIKRQYSLTIFQYIFPYTAILIVAFLSWFYYDNSIYEVIRDITYLLKPILGLLVGYQLCRHANMKVIQTIIYVGFIIAVIHLGTIAFNVVVHKVLNIHELRKYAGYFSDFEVYALILVIFHEKFNVELSRQRFWILLLTIAFSSFLYLSRANFIQAVVFYMALKGYFVMNKRALIILITFFSTVIIGYTIIYNMSLTRNGRGLEALLYKIKNAPIEAFKSKVDKDDWKDFNDNYRAYENMLTIRVMKSEGFWGMVRGKGLGSDVKLGQKLYTNDGTVLTRISILHNAFMTVFLKSGLIGVFFMLYFLRLLLTKRKTNDEYIRNLGILIFATGIYLFFDNWVLLGLYLKTESKSVIIGFILCYIEYNIKQQKTSQLEPQT
ncbi:hypothetical protein [Flavobacterium wongokense]|uniref:hypothetical protein n=1 Tax=Flavobacterium wongokense TaxID=2910674 RepID=UPI001F370B95|nr:hypothetical protein [Flavobacterium sp. WG47]MCF6131471.1 hypothetical protein [Flavobacterium sp. WG47]